MAFQDGEDSLCCGQFNPLNEHIFAVAGDSSGSISIWDMRMKSEALNNFVHHQKQVISLEWCPSKSNILASGSDDNQVLIWDQDMVGSEQARENYEDGPPEMIFPHVHHSSSIEDVQWRPVMVGESESPSYLRLCSMETEMQMQLWQVNEEFTEKEFDILHLSEFIRDEEVE
mmetsp:Transcript_11746/g.19821  ORF Transcript_11746/g.19821 Transcript_11746/m.19821 type:complete len:172 (-) Transcript_11746:9-524(-)